MLEGDVEGLFMQGRDLERGVNVDVLHTVLKQPWVVGTVCNTIGIKYNVRFHMSPCITGSASSGTCLGSKMHL